MKFIGFSLHSRLTSNQHYLILLLFISAVLIFLDLGLFSLSFIFGVSLLFYSLFKTPKLLQINGNIKLLMLFLFIALTSILFSPVQITFSQLKIYIQTIYWFLLAVIVYNAYPAIDKTKLSKYILGASVLLLTLYVIGFRKGMSQNAVAFSVIICAPLGYHYLNKWWKKGAFALLLTFLMLLNGSRTGAILTFIQAGLILAFSIPAVTRHIKTTLILMLLLLTTANIDPIRIKLGEIITPFNSRVGLLMIDPDYVMSYDMSWLQRKAQMQKGKQIFAEHPLLGIGYDNFVQYDIVIDESKIKSARALRNIDNRSSHNSYISLLAETGLLGLITVLLFFLGCIRPFWKSINQLSNTFEAGVFISFIGMLVYFYMVSAFMGTSTWIMFGLIAGASHHLGITTTKQ